MTKKTTTSHSELSTISLHYDDQANTCLRLVELRKPIDHAKAYGRIAIAVPVSSIGKIEQRVTQSGDRIHTAPITLDTPGKATVSVIILIDRDGYEICFVGAEAFWELSQPTYDQIDWATRSSLGADR